MRRPRRPALAAVVLTAALIGSTASAASAAASDDDDQAGIAEDQFAAYLVANTGLVPTAVTCTPETGSTDSLICFALVEGRQTVAAAAIPTAPGVYAFVAITKTTAAAPAVTTATADATASDTTAANAATATAIDSAVADVGVLTSYLAEAQPGVSVDSLSYDPATVTVQLVVTTATTDPAARDQLAWFLTDTMAYLWEAGRPLRDEASTIDPRLEVIVDGVVYGTPYDVMVAVADYQIGFDQWLAISNPPAG